VNIYKNFSYKKIFKVFILSLPIFLLQNISLPIPVEEPFPTEETTQTTIPTIPEAATSTTPEEQENILMYGDRIRLRFANLPSKALHSHEKNYYHQNSSKQQQITGYLNPAAETQYQLDQDDEEWIILGPSAMYDQYLQGQPVAASKNVDGTVTAPIVRLYHPKTKKYLHYHFNTIYKAPLSTTLLEVTATNENFGNIWQINISSNSNEKNEIIYGKTLFTIEAQSGIDYKYLTVLKNNFRLSADVTDPLRHPIVGLNNTALSWFVEPIAAQPQSPPTPKVVPEEIVTKPTEVPTTAAITNVPNVMWGINSFDKALFRQNITTKNPHGLSWSYLSNTGIDVKIIQHITVGPQNTIWVINNLGQLYYREGASATNAVGTSWSTIKDNNVIRFYDISAGAGGLTWAISIERKVYYKQGTTTANYKGSSWIEIPLTGLNQNDYPEQISVAPNGNIAIITINGNIYHRTVTAATPQGTVWNKVTTVGLNPNERMKQISLGSNGKSWAINNNQKIYFITNIKDPAASWGEITGGLLSQISVSSNDVVYGVNANGKLYIRREITQNNPIGTRWENISSNIYKVALSPHGTAYVITRGQFSFYPENQLTFSQFTGSKISYLSPNMQWVNIPLQNITPIELQTITINSQGMVFALDKLFNSYYRANINSQNTQGSNWVKFDSHQPLTLALGETTAGSTLWRTSIASTPQKVKTGITAVNPLGSLEVQELNPPFTVKQFAPGPNGLVWALSSQLKADNDFIPYFKKENQWIEDSSIGLAQLSLGKTVAGVCLWGITSDNKVFLKRNITAANPAGDAWQEITGKEIKQIFVSPNGTVWALSTEEHYKYKNSYWLYYRNGITTTKADGSSWEAVNSAIASLPGTPSNYLKYGDKISLCVALTEQNATFKGGTFVDTENLLALCNGLNGKKTQVLQVLNPANLADKSLVRYDAPVIFKSSQNKYIGIIQNTFLHSNVGLPTNAAPFTFVNINPNLIGNMYIQYGSKISIKGANKNLALNDVSYLNSNLVLEAETRHGSNLFIVLKPINSELPPAQSAIDRIDTHLSLLIKQMNKNWTNVITNAQDVFAQIIATLHANQKNIPSEILTTILQYCVSAEKEMLLAQNQRNYITQSLLTTIKSNLGTNFQPLIVTIINQFKEGLVTIINPADAVVKLLETFNNNVNIMTQNEREDFRELLTLVHQRATFLNATQKDSILTMVNALGGEKTIETTSAIPTTP